MTKKNCKVCGLHKEACLHQKEFNEDKYDRRVIRILWFAIGFLSAGISVITILILINEKYI